MVLAADAGISFSETFLAIVEFLEAAVHTILYLRQVYPPEAFVRRKKYDAPVYQSRHPGLNEYISGALKAVRDEMMLGHVDKVIVVIKDGNDVALERFIFSVKGMIEVPVQGRDDPIQGAMSPGQLAGYFRSFLVKLGMVEGTLRELPIDDGTSFAIVLEVPEEARPTASQQGDPPPWMPAVLQHSSEGVGDDSKLHVVRALNTGVIDLSMMVQESEAKLHGARRKEKGKGRATDED
ncbi:DNA-binding protein [Dacryopinax primogenitus]|uniref:DNA-binding protein n=1 Tax=Dacryopinax primogenitus (strain DJM 731) TaxID=1858805 RepID=M5FW75_DACPD|nr:DNA-binding protein [Dacryopinax primogenitus]EJT99924.1 DNA-binding protein [Dacryopinax primogenitus]